MAMLSLALFGSPQISGGNGAGVALRSRKQLALLIYLAVEQGRSHSRDTLLALLWPEASEEAARNNLRVALADVRRLLGEAEPPFISATRHSLRFDPASPHRLDVAAFRALLDATRRHTHEALERCAACVERLEEAVALYAGEFLHGFGLPDSAGFEEWAAVQREQLHQQQLDALDTLTRAHELRGDHAAQVAYARRQLALEPWREAAYAQLMRGLWASGQRGAALEQYEACRRSLAAELGIEPSPELTALYKQMRGDTVASGGDKETGRQGDSISPSPASAASISPLRDWSEMPTTESFNGREAEQATLEGWLGPERCRLITIVGMGGVGKTTLAARCARRGAPQFAAVIWRSLLNAPPLQELLRGILHALFAGSSHALPDNLDDQLRLLLAVFQRDRCLLVLDNLESILTPGPELGAMRPGYEGYAYLIQQLGTAEHRSCLLLTSREQPQALARLVGHAASVRLLSLGGIDAQAGHALLRQHGLDASPPEAAALVEHYSGNPLALQIVANTIVDLFAGDVASFRDEAAGVFDTIRHVLDEQWERLSENEREVLLWLAVERVPVPLPTLRADLLRPPSPRVLLETVQGLRKRSLLEQRGPTLALQNVVTEYLTELLADRLVRELEGEQLDWLHRYALLKADAPEYVRQSQLRVMVEPIAGQLVATHGRDGVAALSGRLLDALRRAGQRQPSYAAGTLLNLLVYLQIDLRGFDFSQLCVWQADLRDVTALDVNFAGAAFASAAFTDLFDSVNGVAISPDGQFVAACSNNGVVGVWRVADGQRHLMLAGHTTSAWSVAFRPDGALLASSGDDGTVRLWSVTSGQLVHTLHEQFRGIGALAFVPETALLAAISHDGAVLLHDTRDLSTAPRVVARPKDSGLLTVSVSRELVATCGRDGLACVWRLADGQIQYTFSERLHTLRFAFSPDGRLLATGHKDGSVRVWDAATGELVRAMEGHGAGISVYAITWAPTGEQLASGGSDAMIYLWEVTTGRAVRVLRGNTGNVNGLAWSRNGKLLTSAGSDETVRLWSVESGDELRLLRGHAAGVLSLAFGNAAAALASTQGHVVRIWDMERRRLRLTLRGHRSMITQIVWSRDGALLVAARVDGTVWVWDAITWRLRHTLQSRGAWRADFSPAGTLLALSGEDGVVRLWEMASGSLVKQLEGHTGSVEALSFSPDGGLLYSASNDGSVRVWEVGSGRERAMLRDPHGSSLVALALSPDGRLLAHNTSGGIIVWDVERGEQLRRLSCTHASVSRLAWSPDGALLASGNADFTLCLWDVQRGELRASGAQRSWVSAVTWSPDGALLVSSGTLGEIVLWDGRTGARIGELHDAGPYAGTNIADAVGLTDAQRAALRALGAVEEAAQALG